MRGLSPALVVMLAGVALAIGAGGMVVTDSPARRSPTLVFPGAIVIEPARAPRTAVPIATESVGVGVVRYQGAARGGRAA